MVAQKGKALLLKISNGDEPETFSTVGGLRTKSVILNAQTVDVSHSESPGWRELLAGAGLRQAAVSGRGVLLNDAAANRLRSIFFAGTIVPWQVIIPGMGMLQGLFQLSRFELAGEHAREVTMTISLESAGEIAFTEV
jgi:TP901-1 family phage major tail protein